MFGVAVIDILGFVAIFAACGGMLVLANRIEPHWVSKDEERFMTVAQDLDQFGRPLGRKREVRGHIDLDDNAVYLRRRAMVRGSSGIWKVHAKSPTPPRGRVIYLLDKISGDIDSVRLALRFPAKSKMIEHFDSLLARTGTAAPRRNPTGTPTYEDDSPA